MRLKNLQYPLLSVVVLAAAICVPSSSFSQKNESSANQANVNQRQMGKSLTNALPDAPRPKILSRQEWKAKDAIEKMQPHTLQRITVHHTASPQKKGIALEKKMQNLQNFSQSKSRLASGRDKPAWPDVPYHYYLAVDGQIAEGRDIKYVGDTNTSYDPRGHALVVLEGNFENEKPSPRQLESLRELVIWLSANYEIPVSEIKAHNDYAATACPGANLKKALPALRQKVAEIRNTVNR